jgi:hypothetical protein
VSERVRGGGEEGGDGVAGPGPSISRVESRFLDEEQQITK